MRRIEEPMLRFQANQNLMTTKESKKIVKTYNRIARTIIEFETLWRALSLRAALAPHSAALAPHSAALQYPPLPSPLGTAP